MAKIGVSDVDPLDSGVGSGEAERQKNVSCRAASILQEGMVEEYDGGKKEPPISHSSAPSTSLEKEEENSYSLMTENSWKMTVKYSKPMLLENREKPGMKG